MNHLIMALSFVLSVLVATSWAAEPFHFAELIFPLEHWHNHGSCIVECPNGDLLVCWFHGSGERKEDDVVILGARKVNTRSQDIKSPSPNPSPADRGGGLGDSPSPVPARREGGGLGSGGWTKPFLMADAPGFPDTNCCMIIDPQKRLWMLWPTIQAHTWESALMKYKTSTNYMQPEGPPTWDAMKVLHMKPGDDFRDKVQKATEAYLATLDISPEQNLLVKEYVEHNYRQADDKLTRRLGWFTRAHPYILNDKTMLVGLYSDGFSFSLVALTDDWGETWRFSDPIVGGGNIQPSFARKPDGTLVAYMRDNGPPPKRVLVSESTDGGVSWSTVYDHPQLPNPGAGLEVANLNDGDWICIYNNTENGRHSLAVSLSSDQGVTWPITRHLELDESGKGRFHYPSIIQAADGTLHATYSYFVSTTEGERKSIKYAAFNKEWILASDAGE